MQIISYPVHYQSVCTNFDFSLFSRISCKSIGRLLEAKRACVGFELRENSLQIANDIGISYLKITNSDNIYLSFIVQLSSFVRPTNLR